MASETSTKSIRRTVLAPLTLALMVGATFLRREWFGGLNDVAGASWVVEKLTTHGIVAFFVTLGLVSISEALVAKIAGLGRPVIGATVFGWFVIVCLVSLYYTLFGATALLAQAAGKTGFARASRDASTYWIAREQTPVDLATMRKQ